MFDLIGKQVFAQTINAESNTIDMNLSDLNSGVYLISLKVNGETKLSQRITVIRP